MKKSLTLILISFLFLSCKHSNNQFTGYVVHKEYLEGHMCHSEFKEIQQADLSIVIVPRTHVATHSHSWQESQFNIYVANKNYVRCFPADSLKWLKYQLGKKVTLSY